MLSEYDTYLRELSRLGEGCMCPNATKITGREQNSRPLSVALLAVTSHEMNQLLQLTSSGYRSSSTSSLPPSSIAEATTAASVGPRDTAVPARDRLCAIATDWKETFLVSSRAIDFNALADVGCDEGISKKGAHPGGLTMVVGGGGIPWTVQLPLLASTVRRGNMRIVSESNELNPASVNSSKKKKVEQEAEQDVVAAPKKRMRTESNIENRGFNLIITTPASSAVQIQWCFPVEEVSSARNAKNATASARLLMEFVGNTLMRLHTSVIFELEGERARRREAEEQCAKLTASLASMNRGGDGGGAPSVGGAQNRKDRSYKKPQSLLNPAQRSSGKAHRGVRIGQ